jgi:hypothetical protein
MVQLTLRVPDDLAADLKRVAATRGTSVNALATETLSAIVDPAFAGGLDRQLRERLARAGLLADTAATTGVPPSEESLREARAAAGRRRPLSDYVSDDRG